jgi:hypothetical protein
VTTALAVLRARARRLTATLLPLLVLRAVIPFGFMPMAADGRLSIELCPGEGALPSAIAAGHSQHSHTSGHHGGSSPDTHQGPCLFAAGASPAVAPTVLAFAAPPAVQTPCAARDGACTVSLPTIHRTQSARAPPQFA